MVDLAPRLGLNEKLEFKFYVLALSNKFNKSVGYETIKKLKVKLDSETDEFTIYNKIKIDVNRKMILIDEVNYMNDINEIKNVLRHEHIEDKNKDKLINLINKYPKMIKKENEILKSTNLLQHNIPLKTDKPIFSRNYRYPQQF